MLTVITGSELVDADEGCIKFVDANFRRDLTNRIMNRISFMGADASHDISVKIAEVTFSEMLNAN